MPLSRLIIFSILFGVIASSCQPKSAPLEGKSRKEQITEVLKDLAKQKPLYWEGMEQISLLESASEIRSVLCAFPRDYNFGSISGKWEEVASSHYNPLYRPSGAILNTNHRLYRTLLKRGAKLPQEATEVFQSKSYTLNNESTSVYLSDEIILKLASNASIRDLIELANLLNFSILSREERDSSWYTISAKHSPYPVWQVAHIIAQDKAIITAKPIFLIYND